MIGNPIAVEIKCAGYYGDDDGCGNFAWTLLTKLMGVWCMTGMWEAVTVFMLFYRKCENVV